MRVSREGSQQTGAGAHPRVLFDRLLSAFARSTAPLFLVPMAALAWTVSAEQASATTFDIVFTCDYGCTTGVDAPVGSLSIDNSILLDAGNFDSFVPIAGIEVSAFGHAWTSADPATTFGGETPQAYLDGTGTPTNLTWTATAAGIGINFKLFDFDSMPATWSCELDCPAGAGAAFGSYGIVPVPEPTAALLFGMGILLVSPRIARSAGRITSLRSTDV